MENIIFEYQQEYIQSLTKISELQEELNRYKRIGWWQRIRLRNKRARFIDSFSDYLLKYCNKIVKDTYKVFVEDATKNNGFPLKKICLQFTVVPDVVEEWENIFNDVNNECLRKVKKQWKIN